MPVNRGDDEADTVAVPTGPASSGSATPAAPVAPSVAAGSATVRFPQSERVAGRARASGRSPASAGARGDGAQTRQRRPRRAPLALAATVTTAWAALISFVPTMVIVGFAYAVDSTGDPAAKVVRLGLAGWLLAHGVPVRTDLGKIGLIPLVITGFAAWRVARAGVHTARAVGARRAKSIWPTLTAGLGVGVAYGVIGGVTSAAARLPGMSVPVPRAVLTLATFGLICGTVGAMIESGALPRFARALPLVVRDGLRTGAVAALLVLGAGAGAAGMSVALAGGEASQMLADYGTGVVGQAGLTIVCLLYSPTLAVWAASYLVGPGFVLGAGTTVTAAKVTLGPLPAVPAFAGLPSDAAPGWGSVLLGLPLAAGMAAGWLLVRHARAVAMERRTPMPSWSAVLGASALAGPVAGIALGAASLAATGSLGSGQLAAIGPRSVPVALAGAGIVAVGAIVASVATRLLIERRSGS